MLSKELLIELNEYINLNLFLCHNKVCEEASYSRSYPCAAPRREGLEEFIQRNKKPSFCKMLLELIDKKGINDTEIYKKAGIDRRHFSKIRSNPDYHPGKYTAIALALALELDKAEAVRLIGSAGYTLSDSETFDLIITFCFDRKIYDINDVNQALDYFSLKPLAGAAQ